MRFFTENWYRKYYGNQDIIYSKDTWDAILDVCRKAGEYCLTNLLNAPAEFALKKYSFHDAIVERIEYSNGDIVMYLDSSQCAHSVKHLRFKNAEIKSGEIQISKAHELDWFQSEVCCKNGKYNISILFRDWNEMEIDSMTKFDYPKPIILEIDVDNLIAVNS